MSCRTVLTYQITCDRCGKWRVVYGVKPSLPDRWETRPATLNGEIDVCDVCAKEDPAQPNP